MIPEPLKPAAHAVLDSIMSVFRLHLPRYFNLKVKLKYLVSGTDEPDIRFIADKFMQPGQCVIDIGANVGLTAKVFAKAVGSDGTVLAIEPERSNFKYLCANTVHYPQVNPHRIAISNKDEMRNLMLNPCSGTGNSLYGKSTDETQIVECISLRTFCKQERIERIDWIKIDVEGSELDVIDGMVSTLDNFLDARILIELCPANLERAGTSPERLLNKLVDLGYGIETITKQGNSFAMRKIEDISKAMGGRSYINLMCTRV